MQLQLTNRGVETEIAFDQIGDVETAEVLPTLLREYGADCNDWTTLAGEHWRQGRMDRAEELIREGIKCESASCQEERNS